MGIGNAWRIKDTVEEGMIGVIEGKWFGTGLFVDDKVSRVEELGCSVKNCNSKMV